MAIVEQNGKKYEISDEFIEMVKVDLGYYDNPFEGDEVIEKTEENIKLIKRFLRVDTPLMYIKEVTGWDEEEILSLSEQD